MLPHATENIRTVALVGHGASGKTTLAEALLARAKAIPAPGSVERGTTVSDFDALEKSWQHSLRSSVLHFEIDGTRVHLHRHAGLSRLHRAGDRRARRGRDRGRGGQRAGGHRNDHLAHDGLDRAAQALPPDHRQQDRRRERRPAAGPGRDPGHVRQGMPADQSSRRTAASASSTASSTPPATRISPRSPKPIAPWSTRSSKSTKR